MCDDMKSIIAYLNENEKKSLKDRAKDHLKKHSGKYMAGGGALLIAAANAPNISREVYNYDERKRWDKGLTVDQYREKYPNRLPDKTKEQSFTSASTGENRIANRSKLPKITQNLAQHGWKFNQWDK